MILFFSSGGMKFSIIRYLGVGMRQRRGIGERGPTGVCEVEGSEEAKRQREHRWKNPKVGGDPNRNKT